MKKIDVKGPYWTLFSQYKTHSKLGVSKSSAVSIRDTFGIYIWYFHVKDDENDKNHNNLHV